MRALKLACVLVAVGCSLALAENSVVVSSMTIGKTAPGTIGIFLTNDVTLRGIVFPLVIRELTPGVYPTALAGRYPTGTRLDGYFTEKIWYNEYDNEDGTCKNGQPGGFGTYGSVGPSSPDAMLFNRGKIFGASWPPGTDGDIPTIVIDFTAPDAVGFFEVDTTCIDPAWHLMWVEQGGAPVQDLTFTKGIIEVIPCDCPYQCDFTGDGILTATDMAMMIDILFLGVPPPKDPGCPAERSDFNNDGSSDALDLGGLIGHLFEGGPPPANPCSAP